MIRHFLTGAELTADELTALLDRAEELKAAPLSSSALRRRTIALIFQAPSTRTRTSFEAGVVELGGHPMILRPDEMQISRGESVRDTAYILSRHAVGDRDPHRAPTSSSRSSPSTRACRWSTCSPRCTIPARRSPTC